MRFAVRRQARRAHSDTLEPATGLSRREFVLGAAGAVGAVGAAGVSLALGGCAFGQQASPESEQGGSQSQAQQADDMLRRSFFALDTLCVVGGDLTTELLDEVEQRCLTYEALFSAYIETSDVSRVNTAQGKPVELHPDTAELISQALVYCEKSSGLFDITIGAVSQLWDFHNAVVPDDEAIRQACAHVDYRLVSLDGTTLRLDDPDAVLDLGGIAKGFIADKIRDYLREQGVTSAYVNLGGNVCVLGSKPDGSAWNVGVRDPWATDDTQLVARAKIRDAALVTSGLYERSFEQNGKRYWHILDPRTGYPVETELVSASIVSELSIDGEGYTKPLFMLDKQSALDYLAGHDSLQGFFVMADGSRFTSEGSVFES
ncbi:MAG: FAD:protein FMN transferase [Atopobiaceae bacterium]|nr:FAD:protein FMN transferase [Atopobiaceae bacterium]